MRISATFSLVALLAASMSATGQITSAFDADDENWTFSDNNLGSAQTVVYHSTNGNPGGYLSSTIPSSQTMYWSSPAKFNGNIAYFSYGQDLTFDLQYPVTPTLHSPVGDVTLRLPGGSQLIYTLPSLPAVAPAWTSYTVKLDETAVWRVNGTTGAIATRDDLIYYLTNLAMIRINARFHSSFPSTSAAIDNVRVGQRTILPAPSITSFSPTSGQPGSSVIISGNNFDPALSQNAVFFGSAEAIVTASSPTSLAVTVPEGAPYDKITVINKTNGTAKISSEGYLPIFSGGGRIIPASFGPRFDINLTSGNTIGGLQLADIDGDGHNDIVIAERPYNNILVYRNLGTGGTLSAASFETPIRFLVGTGSGNGTGLKIIDLDGDGKQDAVTAFQHSAVRGSFATFRNISTPGSIAFEAVEYWDGLSDESPIYDAADLDGDGLPELMGGEGSQGADTYTYFWIVQNMSKPGDVLFGAPVNYDFDVINGSARALIVDLNNDGKPEILERNGSGGGQPNGIDVINNSSTPGKLVMENPFNLPFIPDYNYIVADFNLDGKKDLCYANFFVGDDIIIRLNTNSGGPLSAADFATPIVIKSDLTYTNRGLSLADINGDGRPDIVATDSNDAGVFENVYSGGVFDATAFIPAYLFPGLGTSTYPTGALASDLNGDNKPDIVFGTSGVLSIMENKNVHAPVISLTTVSPLKGPPGTTVTITGDYFSTTPSQNVVYFGAVKAVVTNATKTQLTVVSPAGATIAPVTVTKDGLSASYHLPFIPTFGPGVVFDNSHFSSPVNFTLTTADFDVGTADLNGDGKPDIVAEGASSRTYFFINNHTTGPITASSLSPDDTTSTTGTNPRIMDIDGDGKLDVMTSNGGYRNASTLGEITMEPLVSIADAGQQSAVDLNRDGKMDVVSTTGTVVYISENLTTPGPFVINPIRSMEYGVNVSKPGVNGSTAVADFDKDGNTDFVATNSGSDNVTVWRNTGGYRIAISQFVAQPNIAVGDNPFLIIAADLDVDGNVDLIVQHAATTTSQFVTVLHNESTTGNIAFTRQDFALGAVGTAATVSDLDGDGKPEIIVTSEAADKFFILKNTSTPGAINAGSFSAPFATTVNNPRGITTSDLNRDGKPEIIITSNPNSLLVFENLISSVSLSFSTQPLNATACEGSTAAFSAIAGGDTGITYQWQVDNGGFADIANNATYSGATTSTLTINNTSMSLDGKLYRCKVKSDNSSDVFSGTATLFISATPSPPVVASITLGCGPISTTITPSSAGTGILFRFYSGAPSTIQATALSYTTPLLTASETYFVSSYNTTSQCESAQVPVSVTVQLCHPPAIASTTTAAYIEGAATIDLASLVSDPDNNLDAASIKVLVQPSSGAIASIDGFELNLDYAGIAFVGTDELTIEVCDLTSICTQQEITVELAGEITVFNGISPNGDGKNEVFIIQYIDVFPETQKNHVSIFNRWGDQVFEISDYNNTSRVFTGESSSGKSLPSGTYFYKIDFSSGRKSEKGYLVVK